MLKSRNVWAFIALIAIAAIIVGCNSLGEKKNPISSEKEMPMVGGVSPSTGMTFDTTGTTGINEINQDEKLSNLGRGPYNSYPTGWKFPFCGRWQISCGYGCSQYHQGNDFYAIDWNLPGESDYGQPIPAPASGYVRASYWNYYLGNVIVVDAGDAWLYRIMHMKSRYVPVGRWVNLGDYLGECGNTGYYSNGSHIHFAVYYPARWGGYIQPLGTNQWGHGISVPQNGISGQWDLREWSYYPSYQLCQCRP